MKKVTLLLLIFLSGAFIFAQNVQSIQDIVGADGSDRAVTDLDCPGASLYSQTPDGVTAYTAPGGIIFDDIIDAPAGYVENFTFWMAATASYNPLTVDIIFKHDNGNGIPGTTFKEYLSVSITEVNTGETIFGYPVLEYTYVLPAKIVVTAGDWVGIHVSNNDAPPHHYWLTSSDGNGSSIVTPNEEIIDVDLSFCLGGTTPPVPISNWAILLGVLLIGTFIVVRYRRTLV